MKKILVALFVLAAAVWAERSFDVPIVGQAPIAPVVYTDKEAQLLRGDTFTGNMNTRGSTEQTFTINDRCAIGHVFVEDEVITAKTLNQMQTTLVECVNRRIQLAIPYQVDSGLPDPVE